MMEWNVYFADINRLNIYSLNVFKHQGFYNSLKNDINICSFDKNEFEKKLNKNCIYYFSAKCEFEIILTCNPEWDRFNKKKIDIYDQLRMNWDKFVNYVWDNKDEFI